MVDDSLLADVRATGGLTAPVVRRVVGYGALAAASGADAILNCCSSVGEAADVLASMLEIPVVKIDDRMASRAVEWGERLAVVATVPTTLAPTARLLERKAQLAGKPVKVTPCLVEGAFDALIGGDASQHDSWVLEAIVRAAAGNDVVVLAQGSMARLLSALPASLTTPVLSSPRLGVEALRDSLGVATPESLEL